MTTTQGMDMMVPRTVSSIALAGDRPPGLATSLRASDETAMAELTDRLGTRIYNYC